MKQYRNSKDWTETTITEIKAFIGCLNNYGHSQTPSLSCYWKSHPYLSVSAVQEVMTSKIQKIVRKFTLEQQFNSSALPRGDQNHDKLHKLRPLIDNLNSNILKHYDHSFLFCLLTNLLFRSKVDLI